MKTVKCWACGGKGYRTLLDDDLISVYSSDDGFLSTKVITQEQWRSEMMSGKDITCSVSPMMDRRECYHCKGARSFMDLEDGD